MAAVVGGCLTILVALLAGGCVRKWPAWYPPVWSPDGTRLYYMAARLDGTLAVREVEIASGRGSELAVGRFASPPVALALSPKGDKVACAIVVRDGPAAPSLRLHILSPGGPGDRVAWEGPCARGDADLCWTPDGRAVLIAADRPGGWGLHHVPADGGAARPVGADLAEVRWPTVSPDGARVAFVARAEAKGPWSLFVAMLDGSSRKVAAPAIFAEPAVGYWPAWSPTGAAVAYVAERYLCPGFAEILVHNTVQGGSQPVARWRTGSCIAPAWSPDGASLAYVCLPLGAGSGGPGTGGRPADILVTNIAGTETRTLASDGLANLMPAWSPDGRSLAFSTCVEPAAEPHVVQIATVETGAVCLAERGPEAEFLLALARYRHAGEASPVALAASAARVKDPPLAVHAAATVAEAFARRGEWAGVADPARRAATAADPKVQVRALQLLATAQMRLGDPTAALATLDLAVPEEGAASLAALRLGLRQGIEAVARLDADIQKAPTPALLQSLADAQLRQLGNPRLALDTLFRLARDFPAGPHLPKAAEAILAACEALGPKGSSYRVLAWAARTLGAAQLTPAHLVLLAETAAVNGDPRGALEQLSRIPNDKLNEALRRRADDALFASTSQLAAQGATADALAALRPVAAGPPGAAAARAAVDAAKLCTELGDHAEAARLLLAALTPQAAPQTMREAIRLLAAGRRLRRDPMAYDVAEVAELLSFGFLDAGITRGEQLIGGLQRDAPHRAPLQAHLAAGFDGLAACSLARGDALTALATVQRWLRYASPDADLPKALARLAACHKLAGNAQAQVETLSRLALDFADRPEGAEARRQLLQLDTATPHDSPKR